MWTKSTSGILQHVVVVGVPLVDAELVADLVQFRLIALADGLHVGLRMGLVDRNELGPEAEPDHRDVEFCHDSPHWFFKRATMAWRFFTDSYPLQSGDCRWGRTTAQRTDALICTGIHPDYIGD